MRPSAVDRMKTLFLDFDGVLHPTFPIERDRLGLARLLVDSVDRWKPRIVISSSWRFHFPVADDLPGFSGHSFL